MKFHDFKRNGLPPSVVSHPRGVCVSRLLQLARPYMRSGLTLVVAAAACYAYWQLRRVEHGHLFALALPWDRAPLPIEIADAKVSAQDYLLPAIVVVITIGCIA